MKAAFIILPAVLAAIAAAREVPRPTLVNDNNIINNRADSTANAIIPREPENTPDPDNTSPEPDNTTPDGGDNNTPPPPNAEPTG